jgi:hypothetical protein
MGPRATQNEDAFVFSKLSLDPDQRRKPRSIDEAHPGEIENDDSPTILDELANHPGERVARREVEFASDRDGIAIFLDL